MIYEQEKEVRDNLKIKPEGWYPEAPAGPLVTDPWAHRSEGMRCKTCMWFVAKDPGLQEVGKVTKGRCRRHAPTMNGYPVVFAIDWCGDHKLA